MRSGFVAYNIGVNRNYMKIKSKRIIYILFTAVMLAPVITGCRDTTVSSFDPPEYVFVPESLSIVELTGGLRNINNLHIAGDKFYFTSSNFGESIYIMNLDGSDLTKLPDFSSAVHPDVTEGITDVSHIHVDNDGYIWVVERTQPMRSGIPDGGEEEQDEDDGIPHIPEFTNPGDFFILQKFDTTGTMLLDIDVTSDVFGDSNVYLDTMCVDGSGNIYIGSFNNIYVLNNEGRLVFNLDPGHGGGARNILIRMFDGNVSMAINHPTGIIYREIIFENRAFGDTVTLPILGDYLIYPGNEQYLFLLSDALNLVGVDAQTGEIAEILNWIDSDISSAGVENITILPDERILLTRQYWDWNDAFVTEFVTLTKTLYAELPQRTLLTLATFDTGQHREAVLEFNRVSTTHRIHIIDYSIFNIREDMTAGFTRLTTEIISGKVPDILDLTYLPLERYAAKGMLVDLYTFIDADPELSRDSFVESVLKAAEVDGHLYWMFPTFSISTLVGSPAILGEDVGWNLDEFKAVIEANPQADIPLGETMTKETFLQYLIMFNIEQFVDWDTGSAHFDSGEFAQLLEYADKFPLHPSREHAGPDEFWKIPQVIHDNRQILYAMELSGFQNFCLTRSLFGGEIVFKGFPAENRNGNAFHIRGGLAITTECEDKQGAWEFLRTFLTDDWQQNYTGSYSFPINMSVFEKNLAEELAEERISYITIFGFGTIYNASLTEMEAEQIMALIDSITHVVTQNEALWNIIHEDASAFFAGQSTLEDTVRIIQSRASIYMSEQSG